MTVENLTAILAERVMGWRVAPDRFIMGGRSWQPKWRFQPLAHLDDAFQLLDKAGAKYIVEGTPDGKFTARVSIGDRTGTATGCSRPATISRALAKAIGIAIPHNIAEGAKQ
jgi:hypothetical protein